MVAGCEDERRGRQLGIEPSNTTEVGELYVPAERLVASERLAQMELDILKHLN
jgi:hypothetical protein